MEVDLGKRGVTHDSGGAGVVCGPGPEASRTQKRQEAKKGQKDTRGSAVLRTFFDFFWPRCVRPFLAVPDFDLDPSFSKNNLN